MATTITGTLTGVSTWYSTTYHDDYPIQFEALYQPTNQSKKGQQSVQIKVREENIRFLNGPRATVRKHEVKV